MEIVIATRKSILAQVQADIVGKMIIEKNSDLSYKKYLVVTEGDKRLDVSLSKIGGKGLFTKEVEMALINKKAEIAVHSMKDVPYALPEGFELVSILKRIDRRDVFVSNNGVNFNNLRKNAVVGTSSVRRAALLKSLRPDINVVPIRGNVQTRFNKMQENNLDGMILASAGLRRLNMEDKITDYFDPKVFLPAVGQGALGIEVLSTNQNKNIYKELNDSKTYIEVTAERAFMRALNGDCHSPVGIYSKVEGSTLYLLGTYMINNKIIKKDIYGDISDNISLGQKLAESIIKGA